jgi:uncharacterized protein
MAISSINGVGLGLRWDFLEPLLESLDSEKVLGLPFFELSPENYSRRGGYLLEALDRVLERTPCISHGLAMSLGSLEPFDDDYFQNIRNVISHVKSPWHSDHLCFCGYPGCVHELLPLPFSEASAWHLSQRIQDAQRRLETPFAVENISYYAHPGEPEMSETQWLNLILEEADCGILLDVNNVYVNSINHRFDPYAWINAIPPRRIVQLHVAGHEHSPAEDLLIDTHGARVNDPVKDLLRHTVARTGPVAVTLERDNNVPALDDLFKERDALQSVYEQGIADYHGQS